MADNTEIKELTKAELQVMQILWDIGKGFVNDIVERIPDPKPAYNTVSTIVRILEKKNFVSYRPYGKSHEYYPLVSRTAYTDSFMNSVLNNFFDNSVSEMVSFFSKREKITMNEMDDIIRLLNENKKAGESND